MNVCSFVIVFCLSILGSSVRNPSWSFRPSSKLISRLQECDLRSDSHSDETKLSNLFCEDFTATYNQVGDVRFAKLVTSLFSSNVLAEDEVIVSPKMLILIIPAIMGRYHFRFIVNTTQITKNLIRVTLKSPETKYSMFKDKHYTIQVDMKLRKNVISISITHSLVGIVSNKKIKQIIKTLHKYIEKRINYEVQRAASRNLWDKKYRKEYAEHSSKISSQELDKVIHPEKYRARPGRKTLLDSSSNGFPTRFTPGSATQERRRTKGG